MTSCISIQILDTKDHKFWRFFFYWYLISFKWLFVTLRVSDLCTVQSTETPFLDIHVCPVASTCSQITKIYTTRTHIHWPCLCIFHVCVVIPVKVYGDMNFAEKGLDPISSFRYLKIKCLSTISTWCWITMVTVNKYFKGDLHCNRRLFRVVVVDYIF